MSPISPRDSLLIAFKKAQENLSPIYGDELRIVPLFENIVESRDAFEKQWKPILDELDYDLRRYYYLSLFENRKNHCHFNVAVWHGKNLCAVSEGGYIDEDFFDFVSVFVTQANPNQNHPLKGHIVEIINQSAVEYAKILGKNKVVHVGGYSPGAIKQLERLNLDFETIDYGIAPTKAYVCNF